MSSHSYLAVTEGERSTDDLIDLASEEMLASAPYRLPLLWQCLFSFDQFRWGTVDGERSPLLVATSDAALGMLARAIPRVVAELPHGETAQEHAEALRSAIEELQGDYVVCEFGQIATMGDVDEYVSTLELALQWLGGAVVDRGLEAALDLAGLEPGAPFVPPSAYEHGSNTTKQQDDMFLSLLGASPLYWGL
jgi:hypothetical protein